MIVPISDRARRWGYLIWPKAADGEMRALLRDTQSVEVIFQGIDIGSKRVDWRHRRISLGPNQTRELPPSVTSFVLEFGEPKLTITCR